MEEIGIISSSNGDTFNERILSYSNKYQIKKEKNREKISHWRENQKDIKNVTGYETVTKPVRNHSKVKESKVKEIYRANALVVSEETTHNGHSNLRKEYQELTATLPSDSGVLPIWKALSKFISDNSPAFPEPYVDLWNIFAGSYKLPKVDYINETRVKKMGTRLQEQGFDFLKVLGKIKSSSHLKGDNTRGWKVTFDWIIENDSNYLKIIEDQYA